jgi:hypothetical protein
MFRYHCRLRDYRDSLTLLAEDPTPFAFLTLAHLTAQQTRRAPERRYSRKRELILQLFTHDWSGRQRNDLYNVLVWMMPLPANLHIKLGAYAYRLQRGYNMPFENSWVMYEKQRALAKGLAAGRAEGRAAGKEAGRREATEQLMLSQLQARCGTIDGKTQPLLHQATNGQLQQLALALVKEETPAGALSAAGLSA